LGQTDCCLWLSGATGKEFQVNVIAYPAIDPVLLELGPLVIRWYALAYIAGIILGWRYVILLLRNKKIWREGSPHVQEKQIDDLLLWITLGVIVGGRLGYVFFYNAEYFFDNPARIFAVWQGGMSFHGGLLGVVLAIMLYAWRNKQPSLEFGDIIVPAVPIGLFFGRIANFINGELYGRVTDAPWAMMFPGTDEPRHPSQLYEAFLEGACLFALLWLLMRYTRAPHRRGEITGFFLAGYGIARSIGELFREPDAHIGFLAGHLTMGMLLSFPMVIVGIMLVVRARLNARSIPQS
jgi:phosphatidylglycerol:prolipoprotein diacylglycerol transferase